MKNTLTATKLKTLLIVGMFLLFVIVGVGFSIGLTNIKEFAVDVSHTTTDASASNNQVTRLQELKTQLEKTQALVAKADNIAVPEANFQSQVITDLQRYATAADISIVDTSFPDAPSTPSSDSFSRKPVAISLRQPVSYAKLIRFLQLIEGSLPKMEVGTMKITRPNSPSGDNVIADNITLNVLVK